MRVERKWAIAVMLAFAAAINYADRAALSAVFAPLRSDLGLTDVQLGTLGSVFLWSYAACSPLAGFLADRVSRSRMVVFSLASWSLVCALTGFAQNFAQLVLARILLGVTECLYLPAATALLADHHAPDSRGTAMAVHSVGLNLGVVAGGTVAGYLADHFGWRPGFVVLGTAGLLMAAAAAWVLCDASGAAARARRAQPVWSSLKRLAGIPSYLILLAKAMLAGVGVWIFLNWLPLFYRETYGWNLAASGFVGTFMVQVSTTMGIAAGGYWSDRLAVRETRNRMLLQSLSYLCAAPFLLLFLIQPGFAVASLSVFLFSMLRGTGQANENPVLCDVVEPRLRSTAIGFMNLGACFAGGIGVLLAGALKRDFGLSGVFAGISILFVIAGLLLLAGYHFFLARDVRRQEEAAAACK